MVTQYPTDLTGLRSVPASKENSHSPKAEASLSEGAIVFPAENNPIPPFAAGKPEVHRTSGSHQKYPAGNGQIGYSPSQGASLKEALTI